MSVECSTSVFAAHSILHSRKYYFVAVLSLTYTPILPFKKIKNVDKIKNVKTVKNVTN